MLIIALCVMMFMFCSDWPTCYREEKGSRHNKVTFLGQCCNVCASQECSSHLQYLK